MACGAPVIASASTAFPEVSGDAALFINPHQVEELANAMKTIIEDPQFANSLRARGLQRALQFTWDESARKTQDLICKPADHHLKR